MTAKPTRSTLLCPTDFSANAKKAAIAREAERFGADLICIASHGRSGVSKALLGSVTQSVMAQTHRPILVARGGI
jgi:nucleotide-binding universal stress UspA family protein